MAKLITNQNQFLKEIIEKLLPGCDNLYFLIGYFYFSGFEQIYKNLDDKNIKILVGLDIEKSVMNSKLIYFWLFYMGKRKGDMLELYLEPLQFIPIKEIYTEKQQPFIQKVNRIIEYKKVKVDTQNLENQIDLMVYKLYELTYKEVKVVDPEFDKVLAEFGLSKEDYERMRVYDFAELRRDKEELEGIEVEENN